MIAYCTCYGVYTSMQLISNSPTPPIIYRGSITSLSRNRMSIFFSLVPQVMPKSVPPSVTAFLNHIRRLMGLDQAVQGFFMNSLSPRNWASYHSALRAFTSFCCQHSVSPVFPLSEFCLACFAGTIRAYICCLRFMQLAKGFPDPSLQA